MARIDKVEYVVDAEGRRSSFCLAHIELMRRKLSESRSIRLIVIDPVGGFIGRNIDDHKDAEVRALLDPLARLAADFQVAIILIKHLGKNANARTVSRVLGSVAWVNSVRCAYVVLPDDEDPSRKLFLPIKSNITAGARGLIYQTHAVPIEEASRILWAFNDLPTLIATNWPSSSFASNGSVAQTSVPTTLRAARRRTPRSCPPRSRRR